MAGTAPYCSRQKGFRKHLIVECRKCMSKKGCRTLQLYLYPDQALNFKYETPLNNHFRGILWSDAKGVHENAN